jgi:ParB family chromosome partitioning protein
VLAEAAPPCPAVKTAIIGYGERVGTTLNVCTDVGRQVWKLPR